MRTNGTRDLVRRCQARWRFKLVAIPLFIAVFFAGYFLTLKWPQFAVTAMPLTALDRMIPFWPATLLVYVSLWVYVPASFLLLEDSRGFFSYGCSAIGLAVAGLAIFFLWPTAVPPIEIDWSQHRAFTALKAMDASGNACPSLHVAFAVFGAWWIDGLLRETGRRPALRTLSWLWCAGILFSTLAIKQHVAIDVAAGLVLGAVAAALGWRRYEATRAAGGLRATIMP